MKYQFSIILFIISMTGCLRSNGQEANVKFDAQTFLPPYNLVVPDNWGVERFGIPIAFAPSIPYVGVEDLRFTPGWANSSNEDYWSYSYLWYLKGKTKFNTKTVEDNLTAYYTGLVGRNIEKRKIPKEKLFPVSANFEDVSTQDGDMNTFKGTVHMLDYMAQEPITLNCIVHVKECAEKDNTFVFFEVSPHEETHPIWNTLNGIWTQFQCDVK
jgi:hypothetical protein